MQKLQKMDERKRMKPRTSKWVCKHELSLFNSHIVNSKHTMCKQGQLINTIYVMFCCCSVAKSCPTLCDSMDCSTPGSSVLQYLPESVQTHVHWVSDTIETPHPLPPPSPPAFKPSQRSGSFPMSPLFTSGGQSTGASASASVLPVNIQGWVPLGLTLWFPCNATLPLRFWKVGWIMLHFHNCCLKDCRS